MIIVALRPKNKTHFLIREINLVNTSFKGFNLTGLGGFLTSVSHMKLGPVPVLDLFMPFIGLPALRGGKTSLRQLAATQTVLHAIAKFQAHRCLKKEQPSWPSFVSLV